MEKAKGQLPCRRHPRLAYALWPQLVAWGGAGRHSGRGQLSDAACLPGSRRGRTAQWALLGRRTPPMPCTERHWGTDVQVKGEGMPTDFNGWSALVVRWLSFVEEISPFKVGQIQQLIANASKDSYVPPLCLDVGLGKGRKGKALRVTHRGACACGWPTRQCCRTSVFSSLPLSSLSCACAYCVRKCAQAARAGQSDRTLFCGGTDHLPVDVCSLLYPGCGRAHSRPRGNGL